MKDKTQAECLVIGANGLIGRRISRSLSDKNIVWIGACNKRQESELMKLDITNPKEVDALFLNFRPKAVFHCANLSGGVNFCELNQKAAKDFHLIATANIAAHCRDIGALMVFMSTDYIFDGGKSFYNEEDHAAPLNLYGRLKLQAENWIVENLKRYLIIRTTNVYGWDPKTETPNYIMGLYRKLKNQEPFYAASFLWGNPTYVGDLADAVVELYMKEASGIFHIVGSSFINRFKWAIEACKILGLDSELVLEARQPDSGGVLRPLKSCLNADKFKKGYQAPLCDVSSGLKLMRQDIAGQEII